MKKRGKLVVLSGPSGCGKNTVFEALRLCDEDIVQTVSATTRAPRCGETDGVDYYFISEAAFAAKIEAGEFLEYVRYGNNYYGTLKSEITRQIRAEKTVVLIIEVNGAMNVKRCFPDAVTIFILPPSMETLRERIDRRGENTPEETARRLQIAAEEMRASSQYDYQVVNDDLEQCVSDVWDIINRSEGDDQHD